MGNDTLVHARLRGCCALMMGIALDTLKMRKGGWACVGRAQWGGVGGRG